MHTINGQRWSGTLTNTTTTDLTPNSNPLIHGLAYMFVSADRDDDINYGLVISVSEPKGGRYNIGTNSYLDQWGVNGGLFFSLGLVALPLYEYNLSARIDQDPSPAVFTLTVDVLPVHILS